MRNGFVALGLLLASTSIASAPSPARFRVAPKDHPDCPVEVKLRVTDDHFRWFSVGPEYGNVIISYPTPHVSLWVGAQFASDVDVVDCRLPRDANDAQPARRCPANEPANLVIACVARVPESGAPILLGAPIPIPTGATFQSLTKE